MELLQFYYSGAGPMKSLLRLVKPWSNRFELPVMQGQQAMEFAILRSSPTSRLLSTNPWRVGVRIPSAFVDDSGGINTHSQNAFLDHY